jgi:hypothetical protein
MAIDINLNNVESTTNKGETVAGNEASTTKYLSIKGVYDWVTANFKATFSENTAFNKNFGTTTGTVAEGNDSRFDKNKTIIQTNTPQSHSGSTNEIILEVQEIAANTFVANDKFEHEIFWQTLGTAGIKQFRVYLNTVNNLTGSPIQIARIQTTATAVGGRTMRGQKVFNATTLKSAATGIQNVNSDNSNNLTYTEFTTDFTVPLFMIVTGELAASADTVILHSLELKRFRL